MEELGLNFEKYHHSLEVAKFSKDIGKVTQVTGLLLKGYLPRASLGSLVRVYPGSQPPFLAEVVGFENRHVLFMPLGKMRGVGLGSKVVLQSQQAPIKVGPELLGRVINSLGEPIDGKGPIEAYQEASIYRETANPMDREPISQALDLGVRSINAFTTVGTGQRLSVLAGSGVGKSVLLGMMAKATNADVNVIALIGERGREVREFIENDLGEEGLKRSVVVVATSDQSPLLRMRGAFVATTIAEYFCDQNNDTLLMMDSITRFAMAQREVGLSAGEPPTSKGYTPSVFALLPQLLERAGNFEGRGSITGIYTVLVEGDDMDDPIADSVRSIVDGHVVLDRSLAHKGHFPAVDVLQSASRVMRRVVDPEHVDQAQRLREMLATYRESEDLIQIGAYQQGTSDKIDAAIRLHQPLEDFLRQSVDDRDNMDGTREKMGQLAGHI